MALKARPSQLVYQLQCLDEKLEANINCEKSGGATFGPPYVQ